MRRTTLSAWVALGALGLALAALGLVLLTRDLPVSGRPAPGSLPGSPRRPVPQPQASPLMPALGRLSGRGVIQVHASPEQASVLLDGKPSCESSPCQMAGLSLGQEHTLELRAPGHQRWAQAVLLTDEEPRLTMRVQLSPQEPSPEDEGTTARGTAPAGGTARAGGTPTASGSATASRRPAASGSATASRRPAAGGSATASRGPAASASATAKRGPVPDRDPPAASPPPQQTPPVRAYNVSPDPAGRTLLAVDVQPWAQVLLDGKPLGHTPLQAQVAPGRHRLELRNPAAGYSKRFTLSFSRGTRTRLMDGPAEP